MAHTKLQLSEQSGLSWEEAIRTFADASPQIVWTADPDGGTDFVNVVWRDHTGMSLEQSRGYRWKEAVHPDDLETCMSRWNRAMETGEPFENEYRFRSKDGSYAWHIGKAVPVRDHTNHIVKWLGSAISIEKTKVTVDRINSLIRISGQLTKSAELQEIVQVVTDEATALTGAQFGAFFYNVKKSDGESYMLYTLSGVPREAFSKFPQPRNTAIFAPTFAGTGPVRLDDVTKDPRYGHNSPHHGMPKGHLPVRSYLAVPVKSRSGEVLGGLFFGHALVGVFSDTSEQLAMGIAAQAALAIENSLLLKRAGDQIDDLKRTQQRLQTREMQLALTSEQAKIATWEYDAEQDVFQLSPQAAVLLGFGSHETSISMEALTSHMSFDTDRKELRTAIAKALRKKGAVDVNVRLSKGDENKPFSFRGKAFYNQGKPLIVGFSIELQPSK